MKNSFFKLAVAIALISVSSLSANAANGQWSNASGGTWSVTGNWSSGTVADGSGFGADFSQVAWGATATITFDQPHTLSTLTFGNLNSTASNVTVTGTGANILTLTGPSTVTVNSNTGIDTATLNLTITGTAGLTKAGTGVLVLDGANTYSGGTNITGGTLAIGDSSHTGSLGTGDVAISSGAILAYQGGGSSGTITNNITGAGKFQKNSSSSSVALTGVNTFTGGVSFGTGGTITASADTTNYGAGDTNANINSSNGGLGSPGTGTVAVGFTSGVGTLQLRFNGQNDSSAQTLTLFSNYTTQTSMNLSESGGGGTYTFDVNNNGGTGTNKTISVAGVTTLIRNGTIDVTGGNGYSLNLASFSITGGAAGVNYTLVPTTGNLTIGTFTNSDAFTGGTLILDGTASKNSISGIIANNSGTNTLAVTKSGSSTWALSGANTYSNGTNITGGTLVVSNTTGSATGTGAVSVATGATLAGAGTITSTTNTINGNVLIGQTSAADTNTTNILHVTASTSTTFSGANLSFNLNTGSTASNVLDLGATSSVVFNGTNTLTFNLQGGTTIANGTLYDLFTDTAGTSPFSGTGYSVTGGVISGLTLVFDVNGVTQTMYSGSFLQLSGSNINLDVVVASVPEPGTWALMLGGFALLVIFQRARRSKNA